MLRCFEGMLLKISFAIKNAAGENSLAWSRALCCSRPPIRCGCPLGKFPFRVPVPGKAALKLGRGGGGLNRCTESAAPLRGLFLSPQEQTAHKARWFPSAGCIQCTSSHRREPFCPPSTPPFQASTMGPFCSAAGNNLLLPSCSEVTFCP